MRVAVWIDWSSRDPADGRTAEAADFSDAFRPLDRPLNAHTATAAAPLWHSLLR
jgi:hypothetical protein